MKVYSRNCVRLLGELPVSNLKAHTLCYPSMVIKNEKYFIEKVCFKVKIFKNEQVLIAWYNVDYEKIKQVGLND